MAKNKDYRRLISCYGILTVLFVLEHYQSIEDYEECKKIIDSIDLIEKDLGIRLPKRIDEETKLIVLHSYRKFNLTGVNSEHNSKRYAELIIEGKERMY